MEGMMGGEDHLLLLRKKQVSREGSQAIVKEKESSEKSTVEKGTIITKKRGAWFPRTRKVLIAARKWE